MNLLVYSKFMRSVTWKYRQGHVGILYKYNFTSTYEPS
jgi:ferredoxin-like protein FixX